MRRVIRQKEKCEKRRTEREREREMEKKERRMTRK
jgi:hypothetical protein